MAKVKANELRIGNYVDISATTAPYYAEICATSELEKDHVFVDNSNFEEVSAGWIIIEYDSEELKPIPITEEWLVKFGLKEDKKGRYGYRYYYPDIDSKYIIERDWRDEPSHFFGLEYTDSGDSADDGKVYHFTFEVKYVHQLQNIIFSLTRQDLKLSK